MVTRIETPKVRTDTFFTDLRQQLMESDDGILPYDPEIQPEEVSEGKIFGLGARERAMLAVIFFITVSVFGAALLMANHIVVLH